MPIILLGGVLYAAYHFLGKKDHSPAPEGAGAAMPALPVTVFTTTEEVVPYQPRFLGQTEASRIVEIRARVAGHIMERTFQEGELVVQGQKLFQIDPRPLQVDLQQANARLASSNAVLGRASLNLQRIQELRAVDATALESLEQAQSDRQVAAANVELSKAEVAAAELQLSYATISSPVNGRIGQVLKDAGNYISAAGTEPLVTVQQIDPMYIRFPVTEKEMLRYRRQIELGQLVSPELTEQEIEVTLADGSVYPHRGTISFQDIKIDQQTGTIVVRGTVPNAEGKLVPGQFIHTKLLGAQRVNVIRVPQEAVLQSPVGASVYVVDAANKIEARPVKLGDWSEDKYWIIEEGLKPGERIVTDRLMMLRPGSDVIPTAPGAAAPSDANEPPAQQSGAPETGAPATPEAPAQS